MIQFLKRAFAVLSGNLSTSISNFLIAGILISKTGLENYGLFVIFQSCYFIWTTASKPVTWQTIVKFAPNTNITTLTKTSLKIELIGILASLTIFALIFTPIALYNTWATEYINVTLAILLGSLVVNNGTTLGYLRVNRNFSAIAYIQVLSASFKVAASLIIPDNIQTYFIATVLFDVILWSTIILCVIKKSKALSTKKEYSINATPPFFELVKFSYWGTIHAVLDLPVTQLDKLLVSSLIGLEVTGVLDIIKKLSQVAGQFAAPIYQVIFPEYSKLLYEKKITELIKLSTILSVAIFSCGAVLVTSIFVGFTPINKYAFSNELSAYKHELITYLTVQSLALCFIWVHPLCVSLGKMRQTAYILIASNTVYLTTIYLLAAHYSIDAVIFAFILQSGTLVAAKLFIISRAIRDMPKNLHQPQSLAKEVEHSKTGYK